MNNIMKIDKSLEESVSLIKTLVKQLKTKQKNKKEDFSQCHQALQVLLSGNLLTGKDTIKARERTITGGQDF